MVRLKWSDALSLLLPGTVTLVGVRHLSSFVARLLSDPSTISFAGGVALLAISAIMGGSVDAIRRVVLDWKVIDCLCDSPASGRESEKTAFYYLDENSIDVYELGINQSYSYYTFYANLSISIILTRISFLKINGIQVYWVDVIVFVVVVFLILASCIQYRYFRIFSDQFVRRRN